LIQRKLKKDGGKEKNKLAIKRGAFRKKDGFVVNAERKPRAASRSKGEVDVSVN